MNIIPIVWVFKLKPLGRSGTLVLYKARCCARGDYQLALIDFDPSRLFAPVASHEAIRILFSYAASHDLIVAGGDVDNAYLYGKIYCEVIIEQPTDSSGTEEKPGYVCQLQKSIYGLRQAGKICGSALLDSLFK